MVLVEHVVCFKLKADATPEQEEQLIQNLRGLRESVPNIVDLSVGRNFTPERGQGYNVGLVVRFRNRADLEAYLPHPNHLPVKNYAAQVCESLLVIDYEF